MIECFSPQWDDYELIDSGGFSKLERFGPYILERPEPQAMWKRALADEEWKKTAHVKFIPEGSNSGRWVRIDRQMPDTWMVCYKHGSMDLQLKLALTKFKHVGIFPEQAVNWNYIAESAKCISGAKILNLFAYTGGASLAARAVGAQVTHCDAVKQVVSWAKFNMEQSQLNAIRWIVDDVFKFVKREGKRGNRYHGIILDPPAFGRGPQGEKWKLEEQIDELLGNLCPILDPDRNFLVLNMYSLGLSPLILANLLADHFGKEAAKRMQIGELFLPDRAGRKLPTGVFARFARL